MAEKILIVDDDLETLRLVGLMLQKHGFSIVAAHNGIQAIKVAQAERPDVIVLDIMMPDMDGYQVTRELRKLAETANTPILMFTAKTQVDDKVAGYEAGVDDYLTKPVHPAELIAHIKSLIQRGHGRAAAANTPRGYVVGVVACRGGMGASTFTLNLAVSWHLRTRKDVIAAELRPGQGVWAQELGFADPDGLNKILKMKPADITGPTVEGELLKTTYGPRLLMASLHFKDARLALAVDQMEALVASLSYLSPLILLDLGTAVSPSFERVVSLCDEILFITEPQPHSLARTKAMLDDLATIGIGKTKMLNLILLNRVRADVQLSITQVQDALPGIQVATVIPPAPELAFQAAQKFQPLITIQPDRLIAQQFRRVVENLQTRAER